MDPLTLDERLKAARAFTDWCLKHPKYAASRFAHDAFEAGWIAAHTNTQEKK